MLLWLRLPILRAASVATAAGSLRSLPTAVAVAACCGALLNLIGSVPVSKVNFELLTPRQNYFEKFECLTPGSKFDG